MKKLIYAIGTLAFLTAGAAQSAHAAQAAAAAPAPAARVAYERPYGLAGCGLGSMVVGKSGGQIFAATTNGTSYSQFFGITLGTSNCVDDPNSEVARTMDNFILGNKAALAGDVARGGGETLSSLTALMGCGEQSQAVGGALQQNFRSIFPNAEVQANEITDSIINVIQQDRKLTESCEKIS